MKTLTKLISSLAAGCLTIAGLPLIQCAAAAGDDIANPAVETNSQDGFSQFQILIQRNIFDHYRLAVPTNPEPAAKPRLPVRQPRIETFSFRGAAETVGKGFDAFFAGDGVPETGTIVVNDVINGFKVREISLYEVTLMNTNHELVTLKDQTGLSRQDGGPWIKVSVPATYSTGPITRKSSVNYNARFTGRPATVTVGYSGAYGGGYDTGFGAADAQDVTSDPATPINPGVLARLQARRSQENQP